jgi:hypothetical protein
VIGASDKLINFTVVWTLDKIGRKGVKKKKMIEKEYKDLSKVQPFYILGSIGEKIEKLVHLLNSSEEGMKFEELRFICDHVMNLESAVLDLDVTLARD